MSTFEIMGMVFGTVGLSLGTLGLIFSVTALPEDQRVGSPPGQGGSAGGLNVRRIMGGARADTPGRCRSCRRSR